MILTAPKTDHVLHPAGVFPAVCVDRIDLGNVVQTDFQGRTRSVRRVRLVFETAGHDGSRNWLARAFNATLHTKSKLSEFLGKWRGRPVLPGESIDLDKLLNISCTLVVSHQQKRDGSGEYASVDAISRPTAKVSPSGEYDPAAARERLAQQRAAAAPAAAAPLAPQAAPESAEEAMDDVPF